MHARPPLPQRLFAAYLFPGRVGRRVRFKFVPCSLKPQKPRRVLWLYEPGCCLNELELCSYCRTDAITYFLILNRGISKDVSDFGMRAHFYSPSPSRLFSTTAQNVPTSRAAPVTQDHLPRCSILFKVSPITSSGDAVGRP